MAQTLFQGVLIAGWGADLLTVSGNLPFHLCILFSLFLTRGQLLRLKPPTGQALVPSNLGSSSLYLPFLWEPKC